MLFIHLEQILIVKDFYSEFGEGSTFPQVILNDQQHLGGCTDTVKYLKEQNLV
jgi:glutaredoxin